MPVRTYFIDIETVGNSNLPKLLLDNILSNIEPDARLTDPEKIKKSIEDKIVKRKDEFALSPLTGKIICCSIAVNQEPVKTFIDNNERSLLINVAFELSMYNYVFDRTVTFNGKSFDIPYLTVRSALYNIKFPEISTNRYDQKQHFDLRNHLTGFDSKGLGTLSQWCMLFGVKVDTTYDGADIKELYESDSLELIASKCEGDVNSMRELFYKIEESKANNPEDLLTDDDKPEVGNIAPDEVVL